MFREWQDFVAGFGARWIDISPDRTGLYVSIANYGLQLIEINGVEACRLPEDASCRADFEREAMLVS